MVFVAWVVVEFENLEAAVVAAALPWVVVAAEPDADVLSVLWPLDVEALDCAAED